MITEILQREFTEEVVLRADLASHDPVYVFITKDRQRILISTCLTDILQSTHFTGKLSCKGITFLLQAGVVPPPTTVYEDLFILSIGNTARIVSKKNDLHLHFSFDFPFLSSNRNPKDPFQPERALELIAEATTKRLDPDKGNNILFHSAGKDSNFIALALAEAGHQSKFVLATHHTAESNKDESIVSKKIADRLGFRHVVLSDTPHVNHQQEEQVYNFFSSIPLPAIDPVSLSHPFYVAQFDFENSNIIDGMGNDVYIGHIPSKSEFRKQKRLSRFSCFSPLFNHIHWPSFLAELASPKAERTGLISLTDITVQEIFPKGEPVSEYWRQISRENIELDYLDFRARVRGIILDQEIFGRKVRNLASATNSKVIFPWMDVNVAEYFYHQHESTLFDRNALKNKMALRKILFEKINLDSDAIGKRGYATQYWQTLSSMEHFATTQILKCHFWDKEMITAFVRSLLHRTKSDSLFANRSRLIFYRLFYLSLWINTHNVSLK